MPLDDIDEILENRHRKRKLIEGEEFSEQGNKVKKGRLEDSSNATKNVGGSGARDLPFLVEEDDSGIADVSLGTVEALYSDLWLRRAPRYVRNYHVWHLQADGRDSVLG